MSVSGLTSTPPPEPAAAQDAAVEVPAHQSALAQFCHRYALLFAWAATIVLFGLLEPESFLQIQNFTSIFNSAGGFGCIDMLSRPYPHLQRVPILSAASVLSLSAMLIAVLNAQLEVPVGWAILVAIAAGVLVGTINGILVVVVGVKLNHCHPRHGLAGQRNHPVDQPQQHDFGDFQHPRELCDRPAVLRYLSRLRLCRFDCSRALVIPDLYPARTTIAVRRAWTARSTAFRACRRSTSLWCHGRGLISRSDRRRALRRY